MSEPAPPKVPLSQRASIDFKCPAAQLHITSDDDVLWSVRGCNKYGFYERRCAQCLDAVSMAAQVPITSSCDCQWILTTGRRAPKR
ncbi:MAG: hypothetical protein KF795_08165 [Labilithrix sp.]|nr:hypothetical protein [Labilithrix sp.]